jgi:tripartite-type tricarboxylate transporter receptor subunit TctC
MTLDRTRRNTLGLAAGTAATSLLGLPGTARAQSIPTSGPIRMLVGYPAGGGTDVMGRIIAEKLKERLGTNVIVENRAGAGGTVANEATKNAPADGSVILYAPSAGTVAQTVTKKSLNYDLEKDLAPITLAGVLPVVFVVSTTIGVKSLPEYIEWLKKNPKKHSFATTAMGSQTHFFGVELGDAIGIPLEPVAYKGAAPIIADLSAGHATAGCGGLTDFLQHHRTDKLRIIAVSGFKRSAAASDLPTIGELGYPKLAQEGWYGFYGPGKMSPGLVAAWHKELTTVLELPEIKSRILQLGMEIQTSSSQAFAERQSKDIVAMRAAMKAAKYEAE